MTECALEEATELPAAHRPVPRIVWRGRALPEDTRSVPEEVPVAVTYNGSSHAVMMASPADLEDFAVGFSLTERIVGSPADILSIDIVAFDRGVEARLWIDEACNKRLSQRRRTLAGPTGCGLCGVDSLSEVLIEPKTVSSGARFQPADMMGAMASLATGQRLFHETRAVHGAALFTQDHGIVAVREDLGRHNALDKLVGAAARQKFPVSSSIVLMTSRISVELVQKCAVLGAPMLMAVSAPTSLAVATAEAAGITLVGVARRDGFEVFTHPQRVDFSE
ncbi:formate dehydrogenase accessory sulfurtransferase FdhD [Consotaella salsifontis]|uniref:Sulfur carrier protein FdhD n=1 Tax=Consotaella salsifontis TaxID=1365950 RepID=A0A1T4RNU5_9HYPH|nr:formate dehydrogenase accessory sulfurtransferase FdhD [Consotaella salsifontis]SKA17547.1 FdhD protein [Consotaella salsifontis]